MTKRNGHKNNHGFTMTEGALFLGVVAIVLFAVWLSAGAVHDKEKMEQAINETWKIANNIRSMYTGQLRHGGAYPTNQLRDLVCGGVFSQDFLKGSTVYNCNGENRRSPVNPWRGPIDVNLLDEPAGTGVVFDITTTFNKPTAAENQSSCVEFINHFDAVAGGGTGLEAGGPVDRFLIIGGSPTGSMRDRSLHEINAAASECTGVRLRFRL